MNAFPAGVTSRARAQIGDAADGAAVDAIELAVGAGRLGRVRGCSAVFRGLTVIACISLATSRARARIGDTADSATVYAPERAVASGPLFRVCGGSASVTRLAVISRNPRPARARATSGIAANHTAVYAPELAVVTRRLGRVRRGRASVGVRAIHASESRVTILTFASIWGKAAHGAAIDAVERPEAAVSAG